MEIFLKHKVIYPLLIVIAFSVISNAQNVDLFHVLNFGKQNYPYLKAKQAEINSAERKVSSVRTSYIPDFHVGHQYTFSTSNNVEGAFFPNQGTALSPSGGIREENIYQGLYGSFTSAMLDWNIVNFGKVSANVDAVNADKNRIKADYQNELFQYQIRLSDAYLLMLSSHYLTEVQRKNELRAQHFMNTINAQVLAGLRPGVDSSLAKAEFIKATMLLLESERNQKVYKYRLLELLGGAMDSIQVDSMKFFTALPDHINVSADQIGNAPLLKLHQSNIELSNARSIAIKRSFYPSITIIGAAWARGSGISNIDHAYRTDFRSGVSYQVYNYLLGLSFRWNLTSYMRIRNDYKSEQFLMQGYNFQYQQQVIRQKRELDESEIQFSVSMRQAELAPEQLRAARHAYTQAAARYQSGLTDLPTLTQSLVTLNRAEADTYIAYSNAWRALLMKAAAAGDLSLFLNQIQ